MQPQAPPRPRVLSLTIKLIVATVLLVLLVVGIFAMLASRATRENVEKQTEHLVRIRTQAIDELGTSTARYLAPPAASPMYDNDLQGLYGLLSPVVEQRSSNPAVYAYIVATNQRVWVGVLSERYDALYPHDGSGEAGPLIQRNEGADPTLAETMDAALLAPYAEGASFPVREEVTRVLEREGDQESLVLQQYTAKIVARNGELLGHLTIAYSLAGLKAEAASLREEGEARARAMQTQLLLLGALALFLGIGSAVFQALAITRNVKRLSRAAEEIAKGDLSVRASVKSKDEIGLLGQHFNRMADRVQELLIETQEKAKLEKELDIARSIQETLNPDPGLHRACNVAVAGYFKPASICGGDFWYLNPLNERELMLCIGDVTGHGVPSAMISAAAKSGLDTLVNISKGRLSVTQLLNELNKTIYDTARRTLLMTFFAMKFDVQKRELTFANAGHNFPMVIRNVNGQSKVSPLVARGNRLGDERESEFPMVTFQLQPGDLLFLFTDGITEYADASGQEFGDRRLRRLLQRCGHLSPEETLQVLLSELESFAGESPQEDDITLVVASIEG